MTKIFSLITGHRLSAIIGISLLYSVFCMNLFAKTYSIYRSTINSGGNTCTEKVYTISGTIGQSDAGAPLTNGAYEVIGGFWSLLRGGQIPEVPLLNITTSHPGFVTISWTPNAQGFILQESGNITATNWINSPSGSTNPVIIPITMPIRFYRLLKP